MGARKLYEERLMELIKGLSEERLTQVVSMIEEEVNKETSAKGIDADAFRSLPKDEFGKKVEQDREQYLKAVEEGVGKFKGILSSTEEFLKRKHEDKFLDREYRV